MKPRDCNTEVRKYSHLNESERHKIEVLLREKHKPAEIAAILGRGRATIYNEIKRGSVVRIQYDLSRKRQYRADVAQRNYETKLHGKQYDLKIGKDKRLEEYIRQKILKDKYSPDAIIGEIKTNGLKFNGMICTKTLYNYIDAGILSGISNENLWEKRKRKKRSYRKVSRISLTNKKARSIELRPDCINNRTEYGHWEGDCIKGPKGRSTGLLTLTERKSRKEIIVKIERGNQEEVQKAIDHLEQKHGKQFKLLFKSITFDNGVEFLGWQSLELSCLNPNSQRTTIYFAHAYSAWERGSNEVQNRMIRRFIPKGTDIHELSDKEIKAVENWMNNYPRKSLGYKSSNQIAQECIQINNHETLNRLT
jgi:IS30 family transposase